MKWYLLVIQPAVAFLHRRVAVLGSALASPAKLELLKNHKALLVCLLVLMAGRAQAQQTTTVPEDSAYIKAIQERAGKIVATLDIKDPAKFTQVQTIVAQQYRSLNQIHGSSKIAIDGIKKSSTLTKEAIPEAIKKEEQQLADKLTQQHAVYIAQLKKVLAEDQVEKVKDGMTYRVLPITYTAYQDMIPRLTEEQKKQIYVWLTEAREYAMDAESSDKKHWWFGKYKGRINNYLAAAGYDLKKEGQDWEVRKKERPAK
jgi:3-phenylpropionate/cinnamic acid dioxygenase small subunit